MLWWLSGFPHASPVVVTAAAFVLMILIGDDRYTSTISTAEEEYEKRVIARRDEDWTPGDAGPR